MGQELIATIKLTTLVPTAMLCPAMHAPAQKTDGALSEHGSS